MRKHHSGYTLVELSVALALAGMIVLTSITGTTWLLAQQRINELSAENGNAIRRINDAYDQLPNYGGLTLRQAVSLGAFNHFLITQRGANNVTVAHPFGGAVGVAPIGVASRAWGLYLNALPTEHCADLLFQFAPIADALVVFPGGMADPVGWALIVGLDSNLPAITISAGLNVAVPRIVRNLGQDLAPAALSAACRDAGNNFGVLLVRSKLR